MNTRELLAAASVIKALGDAFGDEVIDEGIPAVFRTLGYTAAKLLEHSPAHLHVAAVTALYDVLRLQLASGEMH